MTARHKVFVSYHHDNDQNYRNIFELRFSNRYDVMMSGSVQMGDVDSDLSDERIRQIIRDNYLRDTSVTVVLIGTQTWQRKHVDWEISSSIRNTEKNPRSGLLGLLLPSHDGHDTDDFDDHTIPPRFYDNWVNKYAVLARWTNDPGEIQDLIHQAYLRKGRVIPDNSQDLFTRNRTGERWSD